MFPPRSLTILDVGHGNCAIITAPEGIVVIDAGPKSGLLEFLTEREVSKINAIIISHADQDHIAGLVALLSSKLFQFEHIRLNTDSMKDSKIWDDLIFTLDKQNTEGELDFRPSLTINDSGEFNQGSISLDLLGPSPYLATKGPGSKDTNGRKLSTNSISAVVKISNNDVPIALLTGDLDDIGLDDLLAHNPPPTAMLLVFPHHGGSTGNIDINYFTRKLCQVVTPSIIVFSIGRESRYQNPKPEIIETIQTVLDGVHISCTQLSIHCASTPPSSNPIHLCEVFCRGRERKSCCAGSILIDLDDPENILPIFGDHQQFIDSTAPTALCRR